VFYLIIISFIDEKEKKTKFLASKNLKAYNKEKNQLLNFLPEGVIIYKAATDTTPIRIRYVNKTFIRMFQPNNDSDKNEIKELKPNSKKLNRDSFVADK
jgi:hypothetical protein